MEEKHMNLYILGIVALVAIVGLVILYMNSNTEECSKDASESSYILNADGSKEAEGIGSGQATARRCCCPMGEGKMLCFLSGRGCPENCG